MKSKIIFLICWQILVTHGFAKNSLKKHTKILNGQQAKAGEFPYQALIFSNYHTCGGSIIHKRWILTAASCEGLHNPAQILVGASTFTGYGGPMIVYISEKFIPHEDYHYKYDDIALIRLRDDIEFNTYVKPVHLPKFDLDSNKNHCANVSGWGIASVECPGDFKGELHYIKVEILSKEHCFHGYKHVMYESYHDTRICTSTRYGKSVSLGDAGGPVVINNIQHGIITFDERDFNDNSGPNFHTKVYGYVEWIKNKLKEHGDDLSDAEENNNSRVPLLPSFGVNKNEVHKVADNNTRKYDKSFAKLHHS